MRALALLAVVVLLAGCGGSSGVHRDTSGHQPTVIARASEKAAEQIGAASCKRLPQGTLPANATTREKLAALRAYLQNLHPVDSVGAMLKGCRSQLRF